MWPSLVCAILAVVVDLAFAPRVVNGDGLGYLKAALEGRWGATIYPGHVAYVPLLSALGRLVGAARPIDLLWPARIVSALAVGVAAYAMATLAERRATDERARFAAALGLAASFGALAAGSDVESYAPALAALTVALALADAGHAIAAGLLVALAALFHVENVLFVLPLYLLVERRRQLVAAAALPLVAVYSALVATHGPRWLLGASHGLAYPLRLTAPAIAVYGACKALVYSPYPYEASWQRVLGCFGVGVAAALLIARAARRPLPRAVVVAWIVPYALVGVAFYASDQERWIFLLPLVWLAAAARPRRALAAAAFVFAANVITWLPVAKDETLRRRAAAALARIEPADGALVVGPGHGWDEYIGFYEGARVRVFPLVYFAGAVGREALPGELARAIAGAPRVYLARFTGDDEPFGWKELRLFGITEENASALLPEGERTWLGDGIERFGGGR